MAQDTTWCKTVVSLARELGVKPEALRDYASREEDPLPVRYLRGRERGGFVTEREWTEWMERNTEFKGGRGR